MSRSKRYRGSDAAATSNETSQTFQIQLDSASETADYVDEVARLAYSYWEARGFRGGSSEEDWLNAEKEIRRLRSAGRL